MSQVLKHGDKDADFDPGTTENVTYLQELLNQWADLFSGGVAKLLVVDGQFGDATLCRVLDFQTHTLEPHIDSSSIDGIVGPVTWGALIRATSPVDLAIIDATIIDRLPWETEMPERQPDDSDLGYMALEVALRELRSNAQEIDVNNGGKFVEKYLRSEKKWPWCAGFVSWCYSIAAGNVETMPFSYNLRARNIYEQFEAEGAAHSHTSGYIPVAGDLAVWSRCNKDSVGSGHIALVHSYTDKLLKTIDGNKGQFPSYVKGIEHEHDLWQPVLLGFCDIRTMQSKVAHG